MPSLFERLVAQELGLSGDPLAQISAHALKRCCVQREVIRQVGKVGRSALCAKREDLEEVARAARGVSWISRRPRQHLN
jgi:hypothetical protein